MTKEPSLKTFMDEFAAKTGVNAVKLYEHQLNLVREGVFRPRAGRGPGSGTILSAENVAILLITFAATRKPGELVAMDAAVRAATRNRQ